MKNATIFAVIVLALLIVGILFYSSSSTIQTSSVSETTASLESGEIQRVTLSMRNANYYPNTITVKANQPVELTLDGSVGGCFRSFTVKDLGVQGLSRNPAEKIVFTPTKAGTYTFACSMGMGYGKIIVQ